VEDVQFELMLTIVLVVLVMFLFVRTLAATVIPSVAVEGKRVGVDFLLMRTQTDNSFVLGANFRWRF